MTNAEAQLMYYNEIIDRLNQLYGTRSEVEHQFIHEFFEGPIPIFKLILSQGEDGTVGIIIASFHIEIEAAIAINWFLRLRQLEPNLHITACYLRDADGISYVGEDAHILRLYMIEQDILSTYVLSEQDAEDVVSQRTPTIKPSPLKAYSDYKSALLAFRKLDKKSGDIEH